MEISVVDSMAITNRIHTLRMGCKFRSGCRDKVATSSKREPLAVHNTFLLFSVRTDKTVEQTLSPSVLDLSGIMSVNKD